MFSKNKRSKDGHQRYCKDCQKQWYEDNKEYKLEYCAKYRKENHEYRRKASKIYYEKNRETYKKYYIENKEKIDEYCKNWRKENPEKANAYTRERNEKLKSLPHTLTKDEWDNALKEFDYKCAYCGEEKLLEKEHFIPVSKDGGYTIDNILPVCRSCNSCKIDNDFFEWYPRQEFYSEEREAHILIYLGYQETQN